MKKQLKLWVGLVISVVSIWFAFQGIDFGKVLGSFGSLNWWWMLLYIPPYFLVLGLKVTRWQLLFYPGPKISYNRLFSALMISYLWNTILPARLGEVVRAYVVSRSEKIGVARTLSTILLEKILDITTCMIFLVVLLPFLKVEDWIRQSALILGGGVILAFIICMLMAAWRKQAEKLIDWFLSKLPEKIGNKLHGFVAEILDTLTVLLNFKVSLNLWFQSIVMWAINITLYLVIAWAVGLNMTFEQSVLVMITANLGMAVPAAPGYVGTFELVIKTTLAPFFPGQESLVLSFALLQHVVAFLPVVLIGAFYTWREGLSLGNVNKTTSGEGDSGVEGEVTVEVSPVAVQPVKDKAGLKSR